MPTVDITFSKLNYVIEKAYLLMYQRVRGSIITQTAIFEYGYNRVENVSLLLSDFIKIFHLFGKNFKSKIADKIDSTPFKKNKLTSKLTALKLKTPILVADELLRKQKLTVIIISAHQCDVGVEFGK